MSRKNVRLKEKKRLEHVEVQHVEVVQRKVEHVEVEHAKVDGQYRCKVGPNRGHGKDHQGRQQQQLVGRYLRQGGDNLQ